MVKTMEGTGRLRHAITPGARRILFGQVTDQDLEELRLIAEVDRAHLVMLYECGLIGHIAACRLLQTISTLRKEDFAPLHGREAPRGLYLAYENYLIEVLGLDVGGILQTARSRNDLKVTVLLLRLREIYCQLLIDVLKLLAVLIARARRYQDVVMPVYTHFQAAVPVTYGHYLAGVAMALERDLQGLVAAGDHLTYCPLGAGAVGGTTLPIDTQRTAALLGFDHPVQHSIDAVASRDVVLRLLASASILGVTLSRLSADLLLWTTEEFAFLGLPETLVGSSSMMPQKRNPFLLEHVQGRSAAVLGAFVSSATAMHGTPFTNTIAVGTEAVASIWEPVQQLSEAVTLARLVVMGARPNREAMWARAVSGYTTATAVAEQMVVGGDVPFRQAHRMVGEAVRRALDRGGVPLEEAVAGLVGRHAPLRQHADPAFVARASIYGGGPGSTAESLAALQAAWRKHAQRHRSARERWRAAATALDSAARHLCAAVPTPED